MATPPKKITPTRLLEAKDEEEYWRRKSVAAGLRQEAISLDPSLGEGSAVSRHSAKPSISEEYADHYREGVKIRGFREGLGEPGTGSKPQAQLNPNQVVEAKTSIIRALASAGKSPEEIDQYMAKVGPHLDLIAVVGADPVAQSLLYSRVMNSGAQGISTRDIIEIITMLNNVRGPQQNSDPSSIATALGAMFVKGVELAQSRNPGSDPMEAFSKAVQFVTPVMREQTELVKQSFENQLTTLRTELQEKDPATFFNRMKQLANDFGWGPSKEEAPEIAAQRLAMVDAQSQRAFELERERWRHEIGSKQEAAKERRQSEMVRSITGTLQKAFESPVLKQLGRGVGEKIGVPHNPIAQAQSAAAKQALENPMEQLYDFECQKCKKRYKFSAKQLTAIQEKGGRWVCDCGEGYQLRGTDGKDKATKDGGAATF